MFLSTQSVKSVPLHVAAIGERLPSGRNNTNVFLPFGTGYKEQNLPFGRADNDIPVFAVIRLSACFYLEAAIARSRVSRIKRV